MTEYGRRGDEMKRNRMMYERRRNKGKSYGVKTERTSSFSFYFTDRYRLATALIFLH